LHEADKPNAYKEDWHIFLARGISESSRNEMGYSNQQREINDLPNADGNFERQKAERDN
jgi:hypothetical protein